MSRSPTRGPSRKPAQGSPLSKPKRPRTQPEINRFRRQALIEGTIRSLARHGVAGTTVRTICDGAGSSRGLIGHYYESKEELLAVAFCHLFEKISNHVRGAQASMGDSALARLRATPAAVFSPGVCSELHRNAFLAFWHEIRFNEAVRNANRKLYRDYVRHMTALFADAAVECGARIDHGSAAVGLIGLIDGLWLSLSITGRTMTRKQAVGICCDYIDKSLGLQGTEGAPASA
jgi:TetR/AcrR family transcriptional regulator, transcriptional repressor of bet genes